MSKSIRGRWSRGVCSRHSQLALSNRRSRLHQSPTIAQADLSAFNFTGKNDLLPAILVFLPRLPDFSDELLSWLHGTRKSRLELFDVGRIGPTEFLQQCMSRAVPRVKSMHDRAAESHVLAGLWCRMKRVVIAIQSAQSWLVLTCEPRTIITYRYNSAASLLSWFSCVASGLFSRPFGGG